MEFKKRAQIVFGLLAVLAAMIVGIAALYESGFKLTWSGIEKVGKGNISLYVDLQGADIILDNKVFTATIEPGETILLEGLEEGEHSIIVSKQGYWPWGKSLVLPADTTINQRAFLVSDSPELTELDSDSDLHKEFTAKFASLNTPNINQPLIKITHDVAVWLSEDNLTLNAFWRGDLQSAPQHFCSATECMQQYQVFNGAFPITSVVYLAERDDAVIIAVGGGVYALELTPFEQKNFQPMFQGSAPRIMERDSRSIFIEDVGRIFVLQF